MTVRTRRLTIDEVEILSPDLARRMSNQGISTISMQALLDRLPREAEKVEQEADTTRILSFVKAAGGVTELEKVTVDAGFSPELVDQLVDAGELVLQNGLLWLPDVAKQQIGASRNRARDLIDQQLRQGG